MGEAVWPLTWFSLFSEYKKPPDFSCFWWWWGQYRPCTGWKGGRDPRAQAHPSLLPTYLRAWRHGGVQMALCHWCVGWVPAQLIDVNHPGLSVCLLHWQLGTSLESHNPIPNGGNGSSGGSVGEEEADAHATSHWLPPGTEVTTDVAVGISQPGHQRRWGWPHMRGRKEPLFSLIIPHDAACSWCSRKCWSASCPGTGMFFPILTAGTFAGSSVLGGLQWWRWVLLSTQLEWLCCKSLQHTAVSHLPLERATATNSKHPEDSSGRRCACLTWS